VRPLPHRDPRQPTRSQSPRWIGRQQLERRGGTEACPPCITVCGLGAWVLIVGGALTSTKSKALRPGEWCLSWRNLANVDSTAAGGEIAGLVIFDADRRAVFQAGANAEGVDGERHRGTKEIPCFGVGSLEVCCLCPH